MPGWTQTEMALKAGWLALIGALVIAIAAFGAVQTIRLEGLKVWPLSIEGWKPKAEARHAQIDAMLKAQALAAEVAKSRRLAQESQYRDIAERIDDNAKTDLDGSLRAADRFIAAGGMRAEAGRSVRCSTGTAAGDHRAEDPAGTRRAPQLDAAPSAQPDTIAQPQPEGLVLISPADVRICTVNTVKAEAGHELATQLQEASAAKAD
jgi:hypothetical protein